MNITQNKYKHVTLEGYITGRGVGKIYLPPIKDRQEELNISNARIMIDVRNKEMKKTPYSERAMSAGESGTYVITGFYDTKGKKTNSKCSRRTICMKEGLITFKEKHKYTYYSLPEGTKIISLC